MSVGKVDLNIFITMANEENIMEYRVSQLEKEYNELRQDIKSIGDILARLDKKFSQIPDGGLQCGIHLERLNNLEAKVKEHSITLEDLVRLKWKVVGMVSVVTLIFSLVGASIADKFAKPTEKLQPITVVIPGSLTNIVK